MKFLQGWGVAAAFLCLLRLAEAKEEGEPAREGEATESLPRPASLVETIRRCRELPEGEVPACLGSPQKELDSLLAGAQKSALRVLPSELAPQAAAGSDSPGSKVLERAQALARALEDCSSKTCSGPDGERLDAALRAFEMEAGAFARLATRDVVLVSRGGISLGNWQAGFLFALTEALKSRREWLHQQGPVFPVITGASAGAVNAIAAAVSGCGAKKLAPTESMYHEIWLPMGLTSADHQSGLAEGEVGRLHLFSERALAETMQRAQQHLEENVDGIPASSTEHACKVLVGLSTTHLDAQRLPIDLDGHSGPRPTETGNGKLTVSRQKEIFQLELEFRGETGARAMRAKNLLQMSEGGRRLQAVLGHDPAGDLKTDLVLAAARASGAFPVAFPPVTLPYTFADGQSEPRTGVFIDGGTFDNMPLGVAVQLHEHLTRQRKPDLPPLVAAAQPGTPAVYLLLEPNVESWASNLPAAHNRRLGDIPSTYLGFANAMVSSNKDSGIVDALYSYPELLDRQLVFVPKRHLPVAGAFLSAFLAFVEKDFREFDYYVGIADAMHTLRDYSPLMSGYFSNRETLRELRGRLKLGENDAKLDCIIDYFDSELSREPLLGRIEQKRLPKTCNRREIQSFAALLTASHNTKVRGTLNDEANPYEGDGTATFISEAVAAGFIFADTDRKACTPGDVRTAIRGIFANRIGALGDKQDTFLSRRLVGIGGQAAADALTVPRRPRRSAGIGLTQMGIDGYFGWNAQRWWLGRVELGAKLFRFDQSKFDDQRTSLRGELMPYSKISLLRSGDTSFEYGLVAGVGAPYFLAFRSDPTRYDQLSINGIAGLELTLLQTVALRTDWEYLISARNLVGVADAHRVGADKWWRLFATVALQFNTW
ncbi:MAG TPA: patatin-like phospholipase family protein [Polyangiaceae bacterium]|nr:patatin-like phospholipase family protein [Polyangiaceae bacterium]